MSKRSFSHAERYAIWKYHKRICYWCEEPLRIQETTVDHVIPEPLEEKPKELEELRRSYGLPATFVINDYCNWLPSHDHCNKSKSGKPLPAVPLVMNLLRKLLQNAEEVRKIEQRMRANVKKDEALSKVIVALEEGIIIPEDILALVNDPELLDDEDIRVLRDEINLRIDPTRWNVNHVDTEREIATVSDGKFFGATPIGPDAHPSWECPHCGRYGPWDGMICRSCGQRSEPD